MALYLVQHGKSLPKELDPQQGLSEQGLADVHRIAEIAARCHFPVAAIKHSGKKRAHQTAEILANALKPLKGVEQINGLHPLDDVAAFAKNIDHQANIMFVGHLPFMERLAGYLITGSSETRVFKFQNGGILCLERIENTHQCLIKWALMPDIS